jgi:hypothetical protein
VDDSGRGDCEHSRALNVDAGVLAAIGALGDSPMQNL